MSRTATRRRRCAARFLIQAAKNADPAYYLDAVRWMVSRSLARSRAFPEMLPARGIDSTWTEADFLHLPEIPTLEELPRGVLLGSAELVDTLIRDQLGPSPWKMHGKVGYVLRNAQTSPPIALRGEPGWFKAPRSLCGAP